MKKPVKNNLVGTFRLGNINVRLLANPSSEGGSFTTMPEPCIIIGLDQNDWQGIVGVLLHEAFEFAHMMNGHKFRQVPMSNYDSADATFMFDHAKFGRVCADVGCFVADAMPELHNVYVRKTKTK